MDCKGRNGYFKAAGARVWISRETGVVNIGIVSKRTGWNPPLVIEGTPDEIRNFFRNLDSRLEKAISNKEPGFDLPIA